MISCRQREDEYMKKWKQYLSAGLCAVLLCSAAACGSKADSSEPALQSYTSYTNGAAMSKSKSAAAEAAGYGFAADSYDSYAMVEESAMADNGGNLSAPAAQSGGTDKVTESQSASEQNAARKLIRNASLSVETKEFDAFLASVEEQVNALGGSNRNESVEDVTLTYVDMESRKKSLQTEMDRLQEFLEKAETLEDIITLEDRMSTVRYQLESMESQLRTYDNMVDYSTVHMNIQEVKELTPVIEEEETAWERFVNGFKESVEDVKDSFVEFVIWIGIHIPYFVVFVIFALIVALILKAIVRGNRKKKAAKSSAPEQANGQKTIQNRPADQTPEESEKNK